MHFIESINVLLAKLTKEQFEPYKKYWFDKEFRKKYDHIFGEGNFRMVLPDKISLDLVELVESSIHFRDNFEKVSHTLKGLDLGFEIRDASDYIKGFAFDMSGKRKKILDLLKEHSAAKEDSPGFSAMQNIIKKFNERPKEKEKKIYRIVISRLPYDIAGMSTDRRWTSCMALPGDKKKPSGGINHQIVKNDIEEGTLVAYLVEENDLKVKNPWARILIKPYVGGRQEVLLVPSGDVYWNDDIREELIDQFNDKIVEFFKDLQKGKTGLFKINEKIYKDYHDESEVEIELDENSDDFKRIQYLSDNEWPDYKVEEFLESEIFQKTKEYLFNGNVVGLKRFSSRTLEIASWEKGDFNVPTLNLVVDVWRGGTFRGKRLECRLAWRKGVFEGKELETRVWHDGIYNPHEDAYPARIERWKSGRWIKGKKEKGGIDSLKFRTTFETKLSPDKFYELEEKFSEDQSKEFVQALIELEK